MVTSISLRAIDCSCVPGRFSRRLEPIQYRLLAPLCVEQPESTPAVELFFYPRPIVCNAATRPTHPVQRVVLPKASASLDHLPNPSPNTPVLSLAVASLRVPFCNANDLRSLYTCQRGRESTAVSRTHQLRFGVLAGVGVPPRNQSNPFCKTGGGACCCACLATKRPLVANGATVVQGMQHITPDRTEIGAKNENASRIC